MTQYLSAPLLALALVLAFEGAAAARTPAAELATSHEESASAARAASQNAAPANTAPATGAAPFAADRDFANSTLAMRIRICHISRHPRDGVPAEEHACPLLIADATQAVIAPSMPPSMPPSAPKSEPGRAD